MKIAQIGIGGWGENHTRILSDLGVLSAVCDSDSQKSKECGQKHSVNHYDSVDSLVVSEDFDGVFVGTNVSAHAEIVTKLLLEKKHVFVEKPIMFDSVKGEKLKEIAEKNKVIFTCGFAERFNPTIEFVKNSVRDKKYGDLVMLEFYRESKLSSHENKGIVFESSINDIDAANWIFDEMPILVFARLCALNNEKDDFASIMLGYKNNKTAIILSNGFSSEKIRKLRAVCSGAVVLSDLISQEIKVSKENSQVSLEKKDPILLQIQNFIGATEGKNELIVKPKEVINITKIAEAALLSSKQGVPIYLDLK